MNIPNKLTVARMIMVPFFVLFSLTGWGGAANRYICLVIFVGASIRTGWTVILQERIILLRILESLWILWLISFWYALP